MSGFKGLAKGGWHPKGKEGGKESWRGDFKGVNTVAGWMGKGKDPNEEAREHVSAPLSTLKDPSSFGPPPKHGQYHGASPTASTSTGGLGAPVSQGETTAKQRLQQRREAEARAEEEANRPPPGPYKANTTGLSTAHLPKPPLRRVGQGTPPPSGNATTSEPPRLPPRLPPRQNSHPDVYSEAPPPPYSEGTHDSSSTPGFLNQGAVGRLGNAGVSVPGLDIGRTSSPPGPPRQMSPPSTIPQSPGPAGNRGPQLNELQSRFAKLSTSSSESQAPSAGTSWADKQAALNTANNLRNDPSKVSLSDARTAATTANNFRERHGDQAAAGWRTASGLNQKYGVTERAQGLSPSTSTPPQSPTKGMGAKKPPPPPPPKKKELTSNSGDPPPVPLASKPKF